MRNPFRSEAEAFSFVIVIGLCALAIGIAAWLGGTWAGLGVFVGLGLGVAVVLFLRSEPKVKDAAVWERRPDDAKRHILVVANETCVGRALLEEVRYRARGYDTEVLVVAPALTSPAKFWASDVDGARVAAQQRVDASLKGLAAVGVTARGEVGDSDPLQAIEDALRTFGADEIVISTHPPGRSNWLERQVVDRARELYETVPITHVVVDLEREGASAS
jgi:hypothetical protein